MNKELLTSRVSLPSDTAVRSKGNIVSKPGNPAGGFSDSFSSAVCGAEGGKYVIQSLDWG